MKVLIQNRDIWLAIITISLLVFGAMEAQARNAKLKLINGTHIDEGGPGRSLYLRWEGDMDNPPQYTKNLRPGASDTKKSESVGNGHNTKNFIVHVYRIKGKSKTYIGRYHKGVYSPPFGAGRATNTIFKNYTAKYVHLFVMEIDDNGGQYPVHIGRIDRKKW